METVTPLKLSLSGKTKTLTNTPNSYSELLQAVKQCFNAQLPENFSFRYEEKAVTPVDNATQYQALLEKISKEGSDGTLQINEPSNNLSLRTASSTRSEDDAEIMLVGPTSENPIRDDASRQAPATLSDVSKLMNQAFDNQMSKLVKLMNQQSTSGNTKVSKNSDSDDDNTNKQVFTGYSCVSCSVNPIVGVCYVTPRHGCTICEKCEQSKTLSWPWPMFKVRKPEQVPQAIATLSNIDGMESQIWISADKSDNRQSATASDKATTNTATTNMVTTASLDLRPCTAGCGRTFNERALERHAKICKKVFQNKKTTTVSDQDKSEALVDEAAKSDLLKCGQDRKLSKCPAGCGRTFNERALERHAKICQKVFQTKRTPITKREKREDIVKEASKYDLIQCGQDRKLSQCPEGCGRKFVERALKSHSKICKKMFQTKRHKANLTRKRLSRYLAELEHLEYLNKDNEKENIPRKTRKEPTWIERSIELRADIRARRVLQAKKQPSSPIKKTGTTSLTFVPLQDKPVESESPAKKRDWKSQRAEMMEKVREAKRRQSQKENSNSQLSSWRKASLVDKCDSADDEI